MTTIETVRDTPADWTPPMAAEASLPARSFGHLLDGEHTQTRTVWLKVR